MKTFYFFIACIISVSTLVFAPEQVRAQLFDTSTITGQLKLAVDPSVPQPNSTVTIRAQSFSFDLNQATIAWFVDNVRVAEGRGETEVIVQTGESGESVTVEARVRTHTGTLFTERVILRPASVDLMWQAKSYTPPFYRGKALLGPDSSVSIIAIPNIQTENGQTIDTNELVFTWKQGTRVLGSKSGTGKDTLTVEGYPFFKDLDIRVEVLYPQNGTTARNRITISPTTPFVAFYEQHPTEGVLFEHILGDTFTLANEEVTLVAHPFYFAVEDRSENDTVYTWKLNNEEIENPSADPSLITLRSSEGGGTASIDLTVQHMAHVLQQARKRLMIEFTRQASAPIF